MLGLEHLVILLISVFFIWKKCVLLLVCLFSVCISVCVHLSLTLSCFMDSMSLFFTGLSKVNMTYHNDRNDCKSIQLCLSFYAYISKINDSALVFII